MGTSSIEAEAAAVATVGMVGMAVKEELLVAKAANAVVQAMRAAAEAWGEAEETPGDSEEVEGEEHQGVLGAVAKEAGEEATVGRAAEMAAATVVAKGWRADNVLATPGATLEDSVGVRGEAAGEAVAEEEAGIYMKASGAEPAWHLANAVARGTRHRTEQW